MALRDIDGSIGATPIGGGTGARDLLALLELVPAWHRDALCREYPEVSWFPEQGEDVTRAKAICGGCLVRAECREFAESSYATRNFGIWAGESAVQRRRARQGPRAA